MSWNIINRLRVRHLKMAKTVKIVLSFVAFALGGSAQAESTITVAVAANFLAPAEALISHFEQTHDAEVRLIPGSSGKHAAMIVNGGPVDVFMSADAARPDALEDRDLVARRAIYAFGRLAIYVPNSGSAGAARAHLASPDLKRLAIADPRLAPYGLAAQQAIDTLGLSEQLKGKLVIGDNIGQTFGFVATGNADAGFVAYSQVLSLDAKHQQDAALMEISVHAPIAQHMVLTKRGAENPTATTFFDLVLSDEGRALIETFGYQVHQP